MIPKILLPLYCKWIGLVLLLSGYAYGFSYNGNPDDVSHPEGLMLQVAILCGLLLIAGAREKIEDEMIGQMRLTSLQWSVFLLIGLRVVYKSIAFCTKDVNWLPHWQVNSLLLFYLVLFYYQLYVSEAVSKMLKGGGDK